MKVTLDVEPRDLWELTEMAERQGKSLPDFLLERMLRRTGTVQQRLTDLHADGYCDADIGIALDMDLQKTAAMRRALGLRANPRFPAAKGRTTERTSA